MWINYQFMAVCPLILIFLHISSKSGLFLLIILASQTFYPNCPIFFTRIYPSYPWHFPTLTSSNHNASRWNGIHHIIFTIYQSIYIKYRFTLNIEYIFKEACACRTSIVLSFRQLLCVLSVIEYVAVFYKDGDDDYYISWGQ